MQEKTIVIYSFKDDLPQAYLMDGELSKYDNTEDKLNVLYNDDESKNGVFIEIKTIPDLIISGLARDINYHMICVGEE